MRSARQAQACLWPFLGLAIIGCCESNFTVPYAPYEPPSKMWTGDPRTQGWNGVIAEYCVQGDGGIEAIVHSPDGRLGFVAGRDIRILPRVG
jgi:hypothetical protein